MGGTGGSDTHYKRAQDFALDFGPAPILNLRTCMFPVAKLLIQLRSYCRSNLEWSRANDSLRSRK